MPQVPNFVPRSLKRRRLIDWLAPRLPFGSEWTYLSLEVRAVEVSPGVDLLRPWLSLYMERLTRTICVPLLRLPGAKVVELWDPEDEEWLSYAADAG